LIADDGVMSEIARRSTPDLKRLGPELQPEVEEFVCELRQLWAAAGLSMTAFAAQGPIDKGSISRYLRGKRVPCDRWFLDRLLDIVADSGKPITPEIREHFTRLHLRALEAAHPYAYQVRLLRDQLAIAITGRREAERYAHGLEERLAECNREIQGFAEDKTRLRATWDSEFERLIGQIEHLTRQLDFAWRRVAESEGRCMELESRLDLMDHTHPDQLHEVDPSHSVDWEDPVLHLPLDDLKAATLFLSTLLQLNSCDYAEVLAGRIVAHITSRPRSPDPITKHDGFLLRVVGIMNAHGLTDQADELSGWMGYPRYHMPSSHLYSDGGTFS
jgi:hypothetical protein